MSGGGITGEHIVAGRGQTLAEAGEPTHRVIQATGRERGDGAGECRGRGGQFGVNRRRDRRDRLDRI